MQDSIAGLLIETGRENSRSFSNMFMSHRCSQHDILHRDSTSTFRDTQISSHGQKLWLNFRFDIDGIVATIENFQDVYVPFSYLNILPRSRASLIPIYTIVKKHFKLYNFSSKGKEYMRWSHGIQVFSDHGFQFIFALLPRDGKIDFPMYSRQEFDSMQYEFYENFRTTLIDICKHLPSHEISRDTFKKNKILDIRTWHVLPGDRTFILELLDLAKIHTMCDRSFTSMIIASKFGDRNGENVNIEEFNVHKATTTVHAAVTISSPVLKQNLFWSRDGIQELIGNRGTCFSAFSFSSCCNFQTNLDGRCLDISGELRRICTQPEELRFLQFYADVPHLNTPHIHPVFGSIVSCGVLHGNVQSALRNRANAYISNIEENTLKLDIVKARLEIVSIAQKVPEICCADYLSHSNVSNLLHKYPLIVPFTECLESTEYTFTGLLKTIPRYLHDTLHDLFLNHEGKGGFFPVWQAYQYEVANEQFWNGHPNSVLDNTFAVNLGPGGNTPSRCRTWEKGFLCLEDCTVCALDERSIPPMVFWKLTERDKTNIKKILTFSDVLNGGYNVVGVRAVMLLLQDLISDPQRTAKCGRSLLSDLKKANAPAWGNIHRSIKLEDLCRQLSRKGQYKQPYVFWRAIEMMETNGLETYQALHAGIIQLRLKLFPDVRFSDRSKHGKFHWPGKDVISIRVDGDIVSRADNVPTYTANVIDFLEEHGLVHRSKFNSPLSENCDFRFPWMCDIVSKLADMVLEETVLIQLLSYLTAIGLLENHWYVDYRTFAILHNKLNIDTPNVEKILQSREILSKFRLPGVYQLFVYRLHPSLSILVDEPVKEAQRAESNTSDDENANAASSSNEDETLVHDDEVIVPIENVTRLKRRHAPAGLVGHWTREEIEIMDFVISSKIKSEIDAFTKYQTECKRKDISDRTFAAFKAKYHRLKGAARE